MQYAGALLAVPGATLTAHYAPVDGGITETVNKVAVIAQSAASESAVPYSNLPYAETLYRDFCASCHDGENIGAPGRESATCPAARVNWCIPKRMASFHALFLGYLEHDSARIANSDRADSLLDTDGVAVRVGGCSSLPTSA